MGWIEPGVKARGFLCAYSALATSITPGWSAPCGVRVVEIALIGIATIGLVAAIRDRLIEREIIAMGFVVLSNLAHLAIIASLATTAGPAAS